MKKHKHTGYIYRIDGNGSRYKCQECKKEIVMTWILTAPKNITKKKKGKK